MMLENVIALLLYSTFVLFAILGGSGLSLNTGNKKQRLFALLCGGLAVWGFVGALINSGSSAIVALIGGSTLTKGWIWLAPIVVLPLIVLFFHRDFREAIRKKYQTEGITRKGVILTSDRQTKLFEAIGRTIAVCSIINFGIWINIPNDPRAGLLLSLGLVAIGVLICAIPYYVESLKKQENLLVGLISLTLVLLFATYFNGPLSNLIWPLPIFFIMATMVLNNRWMLLGVSLLSLGSVIVYWLMFPVYLVDVRPQYYLLRLCFYGVSIVITGYITSIYVYRLVENRKQKQFQEMIANISTQFVTVSAQDFDQKVEDLLKQSGRQINADRACLGLLSPDADKVTLTHFWNRDDKLVLQASPNQLFLKIDWSIKQLKDNVLIQIGSAADLSKDATAEKAIFERQNIQSLICVPIRSRETLLGFIGFDQIDVPKPWKMGKMEHLRVLASILADAMVKLKSEQQIIQLAYTDALTQLPNRAQFYDCLENAIQAAGAEGQQLGIIFIDLDGFKEVNDTLGHNWGDHLLKKIAGQLSDCVAEGDLLARFGGDEFLMLIPKVTSIRQLNTVADRIMDLFLTNVSLGGQEFYVSASCGIALFPEDGENVHSLIKNADLAMYAAKRNGKAQYVFVTEAMKNQIQEKMQLTNSLHRALEKKQLKLLYQPQVVAETGVVIGFEALLRWEHPQLGTISPAVFIPIAEETGLINAIGQWVLMTACAQNKAWQDMGHRPVPMAVNLSVEQFRSGNLENIVEAALAKTGLEPRYLDLEITETIAMKESLPVVATLHRLKELGITISIDDFGSEFSSLIRLKELPVDRLKIDMAFIQGINVNPKDESIIAVMIQLAKRLGLKIIAEGVETKIQAGFLKDENCDDIQGYYYYKPLTPEEIEDSIYCDPDI